MRLSREIVEFNLNLLFSFEIFICKELTYPAREIGLIEFKFKKLILKMLKKLPKIIYNYLNELITGIDPPELQIFKKIIEELKDLGER